MVDLLSGRRGVPTQLDLFDTIIVSPEAQHRIDALTCLRDAVSDALEIVVALHHTQPNDTRSPRQSGDWAFCSTRAGFRFEHVSEWWAGAMRRRESSGFARTPRRLATWDELAAWLGGDPRRAEVAAWVDSLPEPRWRLLMRPHELWPEPGGWHTSYFCRDHVHQEWPARWHAWQLVLALLGDAITEGADRG